MDRKIKILPLIMVVVLLAGQVTFASGPKQEPELALPVLIVNARALNVRSGPGVRYTILTTLEGGTRLTVLGSAGDNVWFQVLSSVGTGWVNATHTLRRGDFGHLNRIDLSESAEPVPTLAIPTAFVRTGVLNVRSGPGVKYSILAKVTNGTALSVLGMAADRVWYRVEGEFGTGWVNNQFTLFRGSIENVPIVRDEIEGALATPLLIVNTAHLNVRRGPGAHYAVLTTVSGGTELPVEGLARDRVWYRVTTTEDSGWVNVNFTLRRGDFRNVLIIEPITAVAVSEAATSDVIDEEPVTLIERPRLIVNTGFLNIRSGPGAYYTVVGTVPGGTELTILGQSPDRVWYQVEGDFGLGWANSQFGIFRGNWSAMPIVPTPG